MADEKPDEADYLNQETRLFLESCSDSDKAKRIRYIQTDNWIGYPIAISILEKLNGLIKHPRNNRMRSLLVTGIPCNGKTSIRLRLEKLNERHASKSSQMIMPLVSFQMVPAPTEVSFLNKILESMYIPPYSSGKFPTVLRAVTDTMRELEVKLLVIDEIQIITRMPHAKQRTFLDTLKYLSNEISLPFAAFGTDEAINVFSSDPQMNSRFIKRHLPLWNADDDLRRLLQSFEKVLPLKKRSTLKDPEISAEIFRKTNGTIGEIFDVVKLSAVEAINCGSEQITIDIVQKLEFDSGKGR